MTYEDTPSWENRALAHFYLTQIGSGRIGVNAIRDVKLEFTNDFPYGFPVCQVNT
jgi:hypothetical protein